MKAHPGRRPRVASAATRAVLGRRLTGQHFTRPEVADLISAFCIRSGADRVLDPACGDGVLLLAARARLKRLGGDGTNLWGVEVDAALASAARRALGVSTPESTAASPAGGIVTGDFLQLDPSSLCGPGGVDAVVGNPPYVRHELVASERKRELAEASRRLLDGGEGLSGRSDLHVHFWPRALAHLREGGRMGFVTSATWLDAAYGEALRRWLPEACRVVAVIDSEVESWFDDARVRAVITIVERSPGVGRPVRFIRLAARLTDLAPPGLPEIERLEIHERLAMELESAESSREGLARVRLVEPARLAAGRWGPTLRLPGLYFEILDRAGDRLVPLSQTATVSWGIKSGDDRFFFVNRDLPPPVEERYLAPVVFSLMELDRPVVTPDQLRRLVLTVDLRREGSLSGTRLQRYIETAERERGSHLRPTCASRESAGRSPRRWFELRPGRPGEILWSIMHQYRHLAPWNPQGYPANDNLLQIRALPGVDPMLLAALLNSHLVALLKEAAGRRRNEGMLKTQAIDVRRMLIPDPGKIDGRGKDRILAAFDALADTRVGKITEECLRPERRRLDLTVLEALGLGERWAEATAEALADTLSQLCLSERRWEVDAVSRRRAVR